MSDDKYKPALEYIFDRLEREGVAVVTVDDGKLLAFTVDILRRMLADAEASPSKQLIVFLENAGERTSKIAA